MGGNALKSVETRRYNISEYNHIRDHVLQTLKTIPELRQARMRDIPAYRLKDSFGDLDVVIEADGLNQYIWQKIRDVFEPKQFIRNDQVTSFNVNDFQVDISLIESEYFDITMGYYSYNDLGNLIGRVAESLNLKFGHLGLFYQLRDSTGNLIESIPLSKDMDEILTTLGFDSSRWHKGFDSLEDIFEYVISSKYAKPSLYILENRNYKARLRDSKRSTYNKFLTWLSLQSISEERDHRNDSPDEFLRILSIFPFLQERINTALSNKANLVAVKEKYNGATIAALLQLEGNDLSNWMASFKTKWKNDTDFQHWVLRSTADEIKNTILQNRDIQPVPKEPGLYRKDIFREALALNGKVLTEMMTRFPQQWPTKKSYHDWFILQTKESFIEEVRIQYEILKDQLGHFSVSSTNQVAVFSNS